MACGMFDHPSIAIVFGRSFNICSQASCFGRKQASVETKSCFRWMSAQADVQPALLLLTSDLCDFILRASLTIGVISIAFVYKWISFLTLLCSPFAINTTDAEIGAAQRQLCSPLSSSLKGVFVLRVNGAAIQPASPCPSASSLTWEKHSSALLA